MSTRELDQLIARARRYDLTPEEQEAQRQSFAYGNTHFENKRITKKTIREAAQTLKSR